MNSTRPTPGPWPLPDGTPRREIPNLLAISLCRPGWLWGNRLANISAIDVRDRIGQVEGAMAEAIIALGHLDDLDAAALRLARGLDGGGGMSQLTPDPLIVRQSATSNLARAGLLGAVGAASATTAYEAAARHVIHGFARDLFCTATAGLNPTQLADWVQRHPHLLQGHGLERLDVYRYNLRHLTTRAVPSPTQNFKAIDATFVKRFSGAIIDQVDYKYTTDAAMRGLYAHRGTGIKVRVPKGIVVPGATSATVSADELERLYRIASKAGPNLHHTSMTAARWAAIAAATFKMAGGAYRVAQGRQTWEHLGPDVAWAVAEAAAAGYAGTAIGGAAAAGIAFGFTAPAWVPVVVGAGITIGVGVGVHQGATAIRATEAGQLFDAIIGDLVGLVGDGVGWVGLDDLILDLGLDRRVLTVGDAVKKVPAAAKKAGAKAASDPLAAGAALGLLAFLAPTPTLPFALPALAVAGVMSHRKRARRQERRTRHERWRSVNFIPDLRPVKPSPFGSDEDDSVRGDDAPEGDVA